MKGGNVWDNSTDVQSRRGAYIITQQNMAVVVQIDVELQVIT